VLFCGFRYIIPIIKDKASTDSVINSDGWRGYNGLVDFGYKRHFRVRHGKNEFARGNSHINGIESFWGYAKIRLVKFKGARLRLGLKNRQVGEKWVSDDYSYLCKGL
jgi:transposase-like protein